MVQFNLAKGRKRHYENLGSLYTIVSGDLDKNKTISVTNTVFEAISSGLADGEVVTVSAIIKDKAGNATTGTQSSTTITVDQTDPSAFTVGSVVTTGDSVANYAGIQLIMESILQFLLRMILP